MIDEWPPDVRDEDNPLVWCARCQRKHRTYTFTRADLDAVLKQAAKNLADAIDAEALVAAIAALGHEKAV